MPTRGGSDRFKIKNKRMTSYTLDTLDTSDRFSQPLSSLVLQHMGLLEPYFQILSNCLEPLLGDDFPLFLQSLLDLCAFFRSLEEEGYTSLHDTRSAHYEDRKFFRVFVLEI